MGQNTNKNTDNQEQGSQDKRTGSGLGNSSNKPKINFNFYWIYGIIALIFFGMQFLNWGTGAKQTTWEIFERDMLKTQEVKRIVVVNNEQVEIYIKKEKLND